MTNLVQFPGLGLSFEINRVALSIGGFNIYWYGVCIAFGICLALVFAFRHSIEFGVDPDSMVDVILIGIVLGIVSARAYYVAMAPFKYESIWEMIAIRDGGLAIYGGIIGGFLFGGLACKRRGVPVLPMFDLTAMGFLLGQGCGRWGNFFNQEAFGCNTTLPWGMFSETTRAYLMGSTVTAQSGVTIDPNLPVHPTFLYESIWCFVGFLLLFRYIKKRKFNGDIALRYMIWYGAGRFWIEALRTDSLMLVPSKGKLRVLTIPPRALETHRRKTEQLLYHTISDGLYDEVWVEWNGLQPLSTLLSFFPKTMLQDTGTPGDLCVLRRILFVAQGAGLAELLAQTGGLLTEQLFERRRGCAARRAKPRGVIRAARRDPQRQPRRTGRAQPPQRNCPRTGKAAVAAAVAACAGLRCGALPAAAAWR